MTDHTKMQERLNDLVDGELPEMDRVAVLSHLDGCEECQAEVAALSAVRADAQALPRGITPPRDLWQGIAQRIEEQKVIHVEFGQPRRRAVWQQRARLAAAAVVLVAFSSTMTAYLVGSRGGEEIAALPAQQAQPQLTETVNPSVAALAAFHSTETEYVSTVEALKAELVLRRAQLAPETVKTIDENLRIIDRAIQESRAALLADPSNADLPLVLSEVYRKKVELLQSAVQLQART